MGNLSLERVWEEVVQDSFIARLSPGKTFTEIFGGKTSQITPRGALLEYEGLVD